MSLVVLWLVFRVMGVWRIDLLLDWFYVRVTWRCSSPGCVPRRCRLVWRGGRGSCSWLLRGWLTVGSRRRWGSASPRWSPGGAATRPGVCGGWRTRPARGVPGRCLGSGSWPLPWRHLPRGTGSRIGRAGCWPVTWASATSLFNGLCKPLWKD